MAEIEYEGIKIGGSKLMLLVPLLGTLGGGLWGGFEFYKDYLDMKSQIQEYVAPDLSEFDKNIALTKEEMTGNTTKRFYIQDLAREDNLKNASIQIRKDADKEFIKLSSRPDAMKRVLRLLSNSNPDRLTAEQVENALYEIKNSNPKKFARVATDKNLEMKAEINQMISSGVLRKIGNQVIFIDEVLGDTMEDTVVYLKDKKNSGKLTILRAKLKELALI